MHFYHHKKNSKLIILFIGILFFCTPGQAQNSVISGTVFYYKSCPNQQICPLALNGGVYVHLVSGGDTLAIDTIDASGFYSFSSLEAATYELVLTTHKSWGGGSATDALAILRHFVGLTPLLTGLKLQAAYVRALPHFNAADAMLVAKRFSNPSVVFASGDWYFESPLVTVDGTQSLTVNVFGICYGDTNGSFQPGPGK